MASKVWRGDAQAIAQISTATPGTIEATDIFTLTCNGKDAVFVATDTVVATVTAGLVAAIAALSDPEWAEITATDTTTEVTLTAGTAGVPFTVTATAVDGGGADTQTLAMATPTANTGPNNWDDAENWSPNGVPIAADDIFIDDSAVSILYGLDQSAITVFASVSIGRGFSGQIGLARINASGYAEYRETYLKLAAATAGSATSLTMGLGTGQGSALVKIDAGAGLTNILVHDTGLSNSDDDHAFQFKGTHVSNTLEARAGTTDLARIGGETAVILTLTTTDRATVRASDRVTLTTVDAEGSSRVDVASAITTLSINGSATVTVTGSGAVTTMNVYAGTVDYRGSGTITTLLVTADGTFTAADNTAGYTVTTNNSVDGSTIDDSHAKGTWTNAFNAGVRLPNVTWDFGPGRTTQIV